MKDLPLKAKLLVVMVVVVGVASAIPMFTGWENTNYVRFAAYLLVTALSARLKISLPRMTGSMSVNLPFILSALIELRLPEALVVAGTSALVQSLFPESKKLSPVRIIFNVCMILIAARAAWAAMHASHGMALGIVAAASAYLIANTVPVAAAISLTENDAITQVWQRMIQLTFPYYVLAAGVAAMVSLANHAMSWQVPLMMAPVMFMVYRSFRFYFSHMRESAEVSGRCAMGAAAGR